MKMLSSEKATRRTLLLRVNILIGFIVLLVSLFLMISGEYSSLSERQAADKLYNSVAIGSILYMVVIWFSCVFSKPFWKPKATKK